MTLPPWSDPEASGIGSFVSHAKFREDALRFIRYLRGESERRLARFPLVRDAVLDFAEIHVMEIKIDHWPDRERWTLHFDFERLYRDVTIDLLSPADRREKTSLAIRSAAAWMDRPVSRYWPPQVDCRQFTLCIDCPTEILRETLELAYGDAKRYTTDDLVYHASS